MVEIEVVADEPSPSEERLLDAEEIEAVAATCKRPTARMQLESLAKKLRKEAKALKAIEQAGEASEKSPTEKPAATAASTPVAPSPPVHVAPPPATPTLQYTAIDKFAFDAGGYDGKFVTLYISLPGVGEIKDQVTCEFQKAAFDLIVRDLRGKSYRLFKDNLEHDIVTEKSKFIVKADKVVIKLAKVKSEYGSFDNWSKLSDPNRKEKGRKAKVNPSSSITDMMKEMYDSGDDNMRKIIGETMLKQQQGELGSGSQGMGLGDLGSGFDQEM